MFLQANGDFLVPLLREGWKVPGAGKERGLEERRKVVWRHTRQTLSAVAGAAVAALISEVCI